MFTKDKEKFVIEDENSIEQALLKIENNNHRSLIVLNNKKVVGTISDGDIRKAMLKHRLFSTPIKEVMNTNFVWLKKDNLDKAKELFNNLHIFIIPIISEENDLEDIISCYGGDMEQ